MSSVIIARTLLLGISLALGACATSPDDDARAAAVAAADAAAASAELDELWLQSTEAAIEGDFDAAAIALADIVRGWPEVLGDVGGDYIHQVVFLSTPGDAPRLALLEALFDSGWDDDGLAADTLWLELATMRLDRGDTTGASAAIARIVSPASIVRLRIDRRFDSLVDRNSERFDVALAMQRELARLARLMAARPRSLDARNYMGFALLDSGQDAAALALTTQTLAAIEAAQENAPPYDDMDKLNWTMDTRATALRRLGRIDEAVAVLADGAGLDEAGVSNVSQALNLGSFLCALGRHADAIATVEPVDGMSPYGAMVRAGVLHCAALGLGDSTAASAQLDVIRAQRDDAPGVLVEALVEGGHLDEAASIVIARLADPATRNDMLYDLQVFREPPTLPGRTGFDALWETLVQRADVQAAVERVGRIERHPIHRDSSIL